MAARAGGPPGGAQVISTFNGGNVVSTQVPSLNFDGQNAGDLIKTVTGIQPNMVNGVTLDNTFVSHQQYRYLPYPVNNRTITWQFTTPNWCHVRDMAINLQCIFRLLGSTPTNGITIQNINETQHRVYMGGYHITNGGLLSMFSNMRIKLGAQVDILTAFEKTKSAYHVLNTWLRGKWDQRTVFALIDRWDAWYPSGLANYKSSQFSNEVPIGNGGNSVLNVQDSFYNYIDTMFQSKQSDCHWERLLSRVLADKGLMSTYGTAAEGAVAQRIIEAIENVSFPFPMLHSLFQQNIMLPPGMQFIIEIDVPMYSDYSMPASAGDQPTLNPLNATWANIGFFVDSRGGLQMAAGETDDLTFQKRSYYTTGSYIGVSVNQTSVFNSITMNTVNLKPEIARSLQDERIKRPLVYNFSQMVATTVGSYFPGQSVYNFTLPPNQAIPTQFLFAWVNPTMYQGPDNSGLFPGQPNSVTPTFNNAYAAGTQNIAYLPTPTSVALDGPSPMDTASITATPGSASRRFFGSSLTPLPVPMKRMIVRRGGFQEIYQYGTYYDGLGNNVGAFCQSTPLASTSGNSQWLANSVKLLGAKNLTPDSTQKYFDHLEEYQWDRKSLNGLGPIERRMKYSYTPLMFTEGKWMCIQMNPCKNDTGQYSSDQNAYSVDVQIELDLDWLNSVNWTGLNANSKLICVRVLPAQLSAAIDGTVRIYTWPNLLISPNAVVSGNPPPAGPGGSI